MKRPAPTKRLPPLSVRLSAEEHNTLKRMAGETPLSTFVKSKVFDGISEPSKRSMVQDYELLAQILSTLGQSAVFQNLDRIAQAIDRGDLELSQEQEESIALACLLVLEIRDNLVTALGLKPK